MNFKEVAVVQQIFKLFLIMSFNLMLGSLALAAPSAVNGNLNVPEWQFEDDELLLVGEWQVIWGAIGRAARF